jgi:hypothetical protein
MGYEVTLRVGRVCDWGNESPQAFLTDALVDLCKPGNCKMLNLLEPGHDFKQVYFFESDGNTKVSEDRYGDFLYAIPIEKFLPVLAQDLADSKKDYVGIGYRRFLWAYRLLNSMKRHGKQDKFHVIIFGY